MLEEEMTKRDGCATERLGTLDSHEKTIAVLGDGYGGHRRPESKGISKKALSKKRNVLSAQMLEVSLSGVRTVLRLERNAMANGQTTNTLQDNQTNQPPPLLPLGVVTA